MLGGEPLLNPQITRLFEIARKYFPGTPISVLTNGTLLQRQETEFWESCKVNNIKITITKYPVKLEVEKIKETAQSYGVKLEILYENDERRFWRRPIDLEGRQDIKSSFRRCFAANRCICLRNGKISCPTALYTDYFNTYFDKKLAFTEKDYIDIYKVKTISEIFNFLSKPIPFCRYCDFRHIVFGMDWSVSKRELSEWADEPITNEI